MNRDSYNAIAAQWDAARHAFFGRERAYLDALLDGLQAPARVLDLGCGTGRPLAEHITAKGHHVTGVDMAEKLLERARERMPEQTWIHSTFEAFTTDERFDAVLCWDALFHVDRRQHAPLLRKFTGMLKVRGRIMLTVGGSAHPAFTDQMFGETFFYDSLPPEEEVTLLRDLGLEMVLTEFMNVPDGKRDRGRYAIVARRLAG